MGKRKAKLLQPKKTKLPKLDKEFECPFCSHLRSVLVKMDRGRGVASLSCRICGASFDKRINRLDEAVDVYGAWIDACVAANAQAAEQAKKRMASLMVGTGGGDRSNSNMGVGVGADSGGSGATVADKIGRGVVSGGMGEGGMGVSEEDGSTARRATQGYGVEKPGAGTSGRRTPSRVGPAQHTGVAVSTGALREGKNHVLLGRESTNGRNEEGGSSGISSSSSSNRRLAGGGSGGGHAALVAVAGTAGGSRLRRLRRERQQHDYSTSDEEDEADDGFEFSAAASDEEQEADGVGHSARKDDQGGGGAAALDVLTRLREQQREEEEDDTEAGTGDLFGDDE